jgi:hypothetical protein
MAKTLNAEELRELLDYHPSTGVFHWRVSLATNVKQGAVAGCVMSSGYRAIRIRGVGYKAHRLAWLYVHGDWPNGVIDHINKDKSDNSISNLRDVPQDINRQNQRECGRKSRFGLLGVSYFKHSGKFRAGIQTDGHSIHLGSFDTAEQAQAAYLAAKRQLHAGYVA